MTPTEIYDVLDRIGVEYEVVEIFEGARILNIEVDEPTEEDEDEVEDEQIELDSLSSEIEMDADIRERIYHHSMRLADNLRMIDMNDEAHDMEVFALRLTRGRVRL
jgi:hypothetical protein